MDYILEMIKNISLYFGWIALVIIIIVFFKVIKEKDEEEDWLLLKMIGYYILGGFNFKFNGVTSVPIILPIGFPFYLLTMKDNERKNKKVKDKITKFGFIMLICGFINSTIYYGLEYRDRDIKTSNNSIYKLDEDWKVIKDKLKLYNMETLYELDIVYDKPGNIKNLYMYFSDENKCYSITKRYKEYNISVSKKEEDMFGFGYTNEFINIDDVINAVSKTEFNKDEKQASLYKIKYDQNIRSVDNNYYDKVYLVDMYNNYEVREAKNRELPVEGTVLNYIPMKQESKGSWSSITYDYYVINPILRNNLIKNNIEFITIENKKTDTEIKLEKNSDKMYSFLETLDFENWVSIDNTRIDNNPLLIIKDSSGGVITIYENTDIVKYSNDDEEIYFEASEMILKEIIDF